MAEPVCVCHVESRAQNPVPGAEQTLGKLLGK